MRSTRRSYRWRRSGMDIGKFFREAFTKFRKEPSDDAAPHVGGGPLSFGDNVRIRYAPSTEAAGIAGCVGQIYGETTPSVTKPEVVGELFRDYAINVNFPELGRNVWLAEQLLDFVDHGAGTTMTIGGTTLVRRADGEWEPKTD
jgi:hypothetical protein